MVLVLNPFPEESPLPWWFHDEWCKSMQQPPFRVSWCSAQVWLGGTRWFGAFGALGSLMHQAHPQQPHAVIVCYHGARWGCPARVVSWTVRGLSPRICRKKEIAWDGHRRSGWGCATLCRWMWWMVGAPKGPRGGLSHETQRELGQSTGHLFATNDLPYL